ncbi:GMP synthase [candidate division WOR_3 bacterium SM23_60]|uniref:GMP synthase [glutamine-hydrolyzing] n=1 Tax=candidate division WOR_3 bacterium SM23_60 TaxID=1703780 RepID=A0A0S8GHP8_UNCW3|nr:MAG: GMP synthase [candidate division WOR_3 bacterium SM23_60]
MIAVIDFGSQYTQLIARRVRECRVYSEIFSCYSHPRDVLADELEGLILSGGPGSVYKTDPRRFRHFFSLHVPVLGICYGMQLAVRLHGGAVKYSTKREYGRATVSVRPSPLFVGLPRTFTVWMSHGDRAVSVPRTARTIASTDTTPIAAVQFGNVYGLQFHPEVRHTHYGKRIINNFLTRVCKAQKTWSMRTFVAQEVRRIRNTVGTEKVLCAISGGVDSTVAAAITTKAIGKNLHGVFVDNGLLRRHEKAEVRAALSRRLNLRIIDAKKMFLRQLRGVKNPEQKRKIIGRAFITIFEAEAKRIKDVRYLVQGTLYPDVIESGKGVGPSAIIKSHHNVGGLPRKMNLSIIEPLRMLFKDEVREIARVLKLPSSFIERKPFPGPGLAVRIVGPVTEPRLRILRDADSIIHEEAQTLKKYRDIWQIFAVLLPLGSVGVMGDKRTYDAVCAIRAVTSEDGMTADWARLPQDFLARVSNRITNEVYGINRVVYDITSKPPSTIEWE